MKARRDHQPVERAEAEPHVGVDEDGEKRDEDEVRVDRRRREAEHVERHEREPTRDHDIDQVQARPGQPVERLGRVVDRVQAPEPGHAVKRPMHPVLGEVRDEHDLEELQGQRLGRDGVLEPRVRRPPEEQRGRQHRQHDRHLHHEMAHREVHQVGGPALHGRSPAGAGGVSRAPAGRRAGPGRTGSGGTSRARRRSFRPRSRPRQSSRRAGSPRWRAPSP